MEGSEPHRADPAAPSAGAASEAEDQARIAVIVAGGRATRRRPSRALWLAAAVVGALCAIGFALLLARDEGRDAAAGSVGPARSSARSTGCVGGLGIGLGLGLGLGFVLGRRRRGGAG